MKIITVEHLSKYYTIGHDRNSGVIRYKTFRESMMSAGRSLYQRLRHPLSPNREQVELEEFRALDDVSFEVEQGDRIGIIGRNGAGKSTLLKLLCRITEPMKGRITMRGRVASLLEVGTGFHPELSGRENIYLNGAILGMKRAEIKRKFGEIVDFSGVEKFLDTPVKRYSSGMYVRLAFAVAAHLESEILLIDEVLAVGDAEFQKKCLGKMDDISKNEGRTILFVSHNMGAIHNLCIKGIFLKQGKIAFYGDIDKTLELYARDNHSEILIPLHMRKNRQGNGMIRITAINFYNIISSSLRSPELETGCKLLLQIALTSSVESYNDIELSIGIDNSMGIRLLRFNLKQLNARPEIRKGINIINFLIPKLSLLPGEYFGNAYIELDGQMSDYITNAFQFTVNPGIFFHKGNISERCCENVVCDFEILAE